MIINISLLNFVCLNGTYPEIATNQDFDKQAWYSSYIQTYLERDIKSIYDIGSIRDFESFLYLLASRCSQILNLTSISKELGIAVNTAKKWVSILEASHIIYLLQPYYKNLGKRIIKRPKLYFIDNGLVSYLTGITNSNILIKGPLSGALFENMCVSEIVKLFYSYGKKPRIFFLNTNNNLEIDLLIELQTKLFSFELKLISTPKMSMSKHIEKFLTTFDKLNPQKGKIVCNIDKSIPISQNVDAINVFELFDFVKNNL